MWSSTVIEMIQKGILESLYMTLLSTLFAYVIGLPWGVALVVFNQGGLKPKNGIYRVLDVLANIMRSIPFLIMLILLIPVTVFWTICLICSRFTVVSTWI